MTIKEILRKGYKNGDWKGVKDYTDIGAMERDIHKILLDPDFWRAVGKVEGWGKCETETYKKVDDKLKEVLDKDSLEMEARNKMLQMFRAIWESKSLEDFIKTL